MTVERLLISANERCEAHTSGTLNAGFLSGLVDILGRPRRPALPRPVRQQVSVQVRLAGIALGAVDAGVRADAAVRQHVLLQVEFPPQALPTFWTREGLLSWGGDRKQGCSTKHITC